MFHVLLAALCTIVFIALAIIYTYTSRKNTSTIPGAKPSNPRDGNLPDIAACGSFHEFLLDIHGKYGPIASFWWGPKFAVSIASPRLFKEHAKLFDRPADFFALFRPIFGDVSIQFANGLDGRTRHAAYSRCYSDTAVSAYYAVFQEVSKWFVEKWKKSMLNGQQVPLREHMFEFAIKSMLQASFGRFFESDDKVAAIRRAYDLCWAEMEKSLLGDVPEADSERTKEFNKHVDILYGTMEAAKDFRREHPPSPGEHLFIDTLIGFDLPEATKVTDMVEVFVAGFHTTGLLLTWMTYFMASHPDVQEKVFEELHEILEDAEVTANCASELVYMRQVIDESLRCSVLGPFAARFSDAETTLGGYKIPAGTPVVHALGVMMQDPMLYPDPQRFDPERFNEENTKKRPGFSFEPFGFAGKRKCPGYRFSVAETLVLVAAIVKAFRIELAPGQVVTPVHGLVTTPKEEIWITLKERERE